MGNQKLETCSVPIKNAGYETDRACFVAVGAELDVQDDGPS
jgi:hypothetical protein